MHMQDVQDSKQVHDCEQVHRDPLFAAAACCRRAQQEDERGPAIFGQPDPDAMKRRGRSRGAVRSRNSGARGPSQNSYLKVAKRPWVAACWPDCRV